MLARGTSTRRKSPIRWLQASIATLSIGQPQIGRAADWLQILMQSVRVLAIANLSDAPETSLGADIDRALQSKVKLSGFSNWRSISTNLNLGANLAEADSVRATTLANLLAQ
ncbi:hypothetical protein [Chamaesiphon sp. VAR_69_metabat_338]|uniref:hypothetical protein n=1 Tax=Chamaesiphon sp. VAR_69_metabat_338 TaxID=2964704 RepID=UPI00286DD5A9|nr:hypothetical protein [Chamaesiphon sp. VAR_69_metabat_338]